MNMNEIWGKSVVDSLISQGVTYFCLSPGTRCTPLVLAIAEHKEAEVFVHFDERGSGYHALGYAKAMKKPAAIITTSGTAVGNLMPSVMEAFSDQVSLILLTADRPATLRDTMANQTCDQVKIFGGYVHFFFDLPAPHGDVPSNFINSTVAQAVARSKFPTCGPVQLNCQFAEPFFSNQPVSPLPRRQVDYFYPEYELHGAEEWAKKLQTFEKGIIVLGRNAGAPAAENLSKKLGWPILPDLLSGYREREKSGQIANYHYIVKSLINELVPEVILHLGDSCLSSPVIELMGKTPKIIHVAPHPNRFDPTHSVTDRVICKPQHFCEKIDPHLTKKENGWIVLWKNLEKIAGDVLEFPDYSEPGLIRFIANSAGPNEALFFGISMPSRDADLFLFPSSPCGPIFANRGVSGIDGNLATIAGIAQSMPVTAVVGDQTALYDLNSLAQFTKVKHPIRLFIINNGGGGSFPLSV